MASYPDSPDVFRTRQNLPNVTYDVDKTTTLFAEDLTDIESAVLAIEETVGYNPQGLYSSVTDRLNDADQSLAGKQDTLQYTPENAANKKTTTTLGDSDSYYPSQKAVKTYTDAAVSTLAARVTTLEGKHEYAVGDIFLSFNSTDPATVKGYGTWTLRGQGRTLVGVDTNDSDFNTVKKTGGHKLLQSHKHDIYQYVGNAQTGATNLDDIPGSGNRNVSDMVYFGEGTKNAGGGDSQNLQPYITCYIWERTA
jgi:hypothetical protein